MSITKKITTKCLVLLLLFMSIELVFAEEKSAQEERKVRPIQFSFIYPLGTAGVKSYEIDNYVSLNLLIGVNGGVKILELGGLINLNNGDIRGLQVAGLANFVRAKKMQALQIAYLINGVRTDNMQGVQLAVLSNIVSAKKMQGLQASVITNIQYGYLQGVQIGLVNFVKRMDGAQVGLINIVLDKESKVVPIGIINVVNGGYFAFELAFNETIWANIRYKMGVDFLYTVFNFAGLGYNYGSGFLTLLSGFGLGSNIPLSIGGDEKSHLAIELISYNRLFAFDDVEFFQGDQGATLISLTTRYKYNFTDHFSFLIGPSFNIYGSSEEYRYDTTYSPYQIQLIEDNDVIGGFWIGSEVGVSYEF